MKAGSVLLSLVACGALLVTIQVWYIGVRYMPDLLFPSTSVFLVYALEPLAIALAAVCALMSNKPMSPSHQRWLIVFLALAIASLVLVSGGIGFGAPTISSAWRADHAS